MKLKALVFCAVAGLPAVTAGPAAAQWGPYGYARYGTAPVSPYAIHATLRAHGLRQVTQPVLSGPYLVVRAVDGYGQTVRVLMNARYGNIVQIAPLPPAPVYAGRGYPYGPYPPRYSDARPGPKAEPTPAGPHAAYPGPDVPEDPALSPLPPPPRTAAVTPPRTPLPRPRPRVPDGTASAANAATGAPPASTAKAAPDITGSVTRAAPQAPASSETAPASKPADAGAFPPAAPLE